MQKIIFLWERSLQGHNLSFWYPSYINHCCLFAFSQLLIVVHHEWRTMLIKCLSLTFCASLLGLHRLWNEKEHNLEIRATRRVREGWKQALSHQWAKHFLGNNFSFLGLQPFCLVSIFWTRLIIVLTIYAVAYSLLLWRHLFWQRHSSLWSVVPLTI